MAEKKGFAEYVQRGNNIDFTAADGAEYMQVVSMSGRIASQWRISSRAENRSSHLAENAL